MIRFGASAFGLLFGVGWAAAPAPAWASSYQVLYSFQGGDDGGHPKAALIEVDGTLYGTTYGAGSNQIDCTSGCGTVFALDPVTGTEKVLHSFLGIDDGLYPAANLTYVRGRLYGTTTSSQFGAGTVFSVDLKTGKEKVLHTFQGGSGDGSSPLAGLTNVDGTIYGTTYYGGGGSGCVFGCGTVFALDLATGAERVVYSFSPPADGANPAAGLINVGGTLYGTTVVGGSKEYGTAFALDPITGTENVLHSFGYKTGGSPEAALADIGGTLYGTTTYGGPYQHGCHRSGCGMVFSIVLATATSHIVHFFHQQGGRSLGSVLGFHGRLKGTTSNGGAADLGTVFSVNPQTGHKTTLHSFLGGADGANPEAGLIDVGGTLYGTTYAGGAYGYGTVFAITP